MRDAFRKEILINIKKTISKVGFVLANREKNLSFIGNWLLDHQKLVEILLDLSSEDCVKGPSRDRDGYEGYLLFFKSNYLLGTTIYIKVRFNPPNEVVIISFHEDELNLESEDE